MLSTHLRKLVETSSEFTVSNRKSIETGPLGYTYAPIKFSISGAMSIHSEDCDSAVDNAASMLDSGEGEGVDALDESTELQDLDDIVEEGEDDTGEGESVDAVDEFTQRQDLDDIDKEGEDEDDIGEGEVVDALDDSTQRQDIDDIEEKEEDEDEDENTYPNSPDSTQPQVNLSDSNCCPSYAFCCRINAPPTGLSLLLS